MTLASSLFRLAGVMLLAAFSATSMASAEPDNESVVLEAAQGVTEREGDRLILHTKAGKDAVFLDEHRCDPPDFAIDHCVFHRLVTYNSQQRFFVVANNYYESLDFDWVSAATGNRIKLRGLPAYSSDGLRFLVIYYNEMIGDDGIQIWHVEGNEPKLEWSDSPSDYAPAELLSWQGNSEVDLTVLIFGPEANCTRPAHLTLDPERGWHLTVEDAGKSPRIHPSGYSPASR